MNNAQNERTVTVIVTVLSFLRKRFSSMGKMGEIKTSRNASQMDTIEMHTQGAAMKRFQRSIIFLTLAAILLAACSSDSTGRAQSNRARELNPTVNEADLQTLVDGNNDFALDLYQTLRSEDGNLILSPFSISLALAMTYTGARSETETQMADVLHFGVQEQTHTAFNALDLALEKKPINLDKDQEPMQLSIANSVWAEQTFTFLPDFLDTLAIHYGAGIHQLDFLNNPEPSRKEINEWVSNETEDKINDLLPEDSITSATKMVLTNAIYFKADWADQFEANDTYESPFYLLDGTEGTANMMSQGMQLRHASSNGYQAVELPYAGNSAVMTIIVPDEGRYEEIESALTPGFLADVLASMQEVWLELRLPKFEFESSFALAKTLEAFGAFLEQCQVIIRLPLLLVDQVTDAAQDQQSRGVFVCHPCQRARFPIAGDCSLRFEVGDLLGRQVAVGGGEDSASGWDVVWGRAASLGRGKRRSIPRC
jgi:serpin B